LLSFRASKKEVQMIVDQKEFINRGAKYFHNKAAVVYKGSRPDRVRHRSLTFSQVNDRARRLANGLADRGFRPGNRVATLMHNCLEYLEIAFPQVILNPMLSAEEILFQINNSEADVLIFQDRYAEIVRSIEKRMPNTKTVICFGSVGKGMLEYEKILAKASCDEPSLLLKPEDLGELRYSGGTTGTPKGIMLSNRSVVAVTRDLILDYLGDLTSTDKWMAIQPLFHGAGWFNLPVWVKGMTNYIVDDFQAETALKVIETEKITAIKTIPTVLLRLLDYPCIKNCAMGSVKTIIYGGEPISEKRLKEAIDIFGPVFMQLYGQTEAPMTITVLRKEDHLNDKLLNSAGRPCTMVDVKVVDKQNNEVSPEKMGEIIVKGDHLMMGYLKNPAATKEIMVDGWLHTKDLGKTDEDGYIYLTGGRTSDMIISGGENIFPQEVEKVLYEHHSVKEVCVFGLPNEKWGEAVTAAVVLKRDMHATEDELVSFCKQRIASYKKPQAIFFLDSLPKSGAGKTVRKDLVSQFSK
jgi:acyl-CoA synthetase (AMP-forming)/AMP-acid ligase II